MRWQHWVAALLIVFSTIVTIASVGKKREPITPAGAAVITVINALFLWFIIWTST